MESIKNFISENFQFLEVKLYIYLNMRVSVMFYDCGSSRTSSLNLIFLRIKLLQWISNNTYITSTCSYITQLWLHQTLVTVLAFLNRVLHLRFF